MKIFLMIYIIGMIITACTVYVAVRVYNNIEKSHGTNKKIFAMRIIFYPIFWIMFILDLIADKISE